MKSRNVVLAVMVMLVIAIFAICLPVVSIATSGDVFAVGKTAAGADMFRVTKTGTVVTTAGFVASRTATATGYTVKATDNLVAVTDTSVARAIYMPDSGLFSVGQVATVKDESGGATSHAIMIYGTGNDTIDGSSSATIAANYGKVTLYKGATGKWFTK